MKRLALLLLVICFALSAPAADALYPAGWNTTPYNLTARTALGLDPLFAGKQDTNAIIDWLISRPHILTNGHTASITLSNASTTLRGTLQVAGNAYFTNSVNLSGGNVNVVGDVIAENLQGGGALITDLNASELNSGVVPPARLGYQYLSNGHTASITLSNASTTLRGTLQVAGNAFFTNDVTVLGGMTMDTLNITGDFNVTGSSYLTNGLSHPNGVGYFKIPTNTPMAGAFPTPSNSLATTVWTHDAGSLSNLNASAVASGILPPARLGYQYLSNGHTADITISNASTTLRGTLQVAGATYLTNLNASQFAATDADKKLVSTLNAASLTNMLYVPNTTTLFETNAAILTNCVNYLVVTNNVRFTNWAAIAVSGQWFQVCMTNSTAVNYYIDVPTNGFTRALTNATGSYVVADASGTNFACLLTNGQRAMLSGKFVGGNLNAGFFSFRHW